MINRSKYWLGKTLKEFMWVQITLGVPIFTHKLDQSINDVIDVVVLPYVRGQVGEK